MKSKKNMGRLRKVISTAMALLLLLAVLSLTGCSSSGAKVESDEGTLETGLSYTYSGTTNKLKITGNGAIPDFASSEDVPWAAYRTVIDSVELGEGVTAIGNNAFYYCTALESVSMEASAVATIGDNAFWMCISLEEIVIPDTVTSIGNGAFAYCTKLTSVSASGLSTLGASAFAGCTALTVVSLDGTLSVIPEKAFLNCTALTTVAYPDTVTDADIAANAFLNANADVEQTVVKSEATLTITYVDAQGKQLAEPVVRVLPKGTEYSETTPEVEGYEIPKGYETVSGVMPGADVSVKVVYTAAAVESETEAESESETEAETEEPTEKEPDATTIVLIVLLVVILAAIVVGAVLLMRSGKNITKDSRTVHKNDGKNGKKKK